MTIVHARFRPSGLKGARRLGEQWVLQGQLALLEIPAFASVALIAAQ
jgi:hypothetical protein